MVRTNGWLKKLHPFGFLFQGWKGRKEWRLRESKRVADQEFLQKDKLALLAEIRRAHTEWCAAQQRFEWMSEPDQIDYAIYALEAAKKRYDMLLKQAKETNPADQQQYGETGDVQ